ncbi:MULTISPECIES: GntP family permease [unclassified Curtobacterium]|uniref:GntP family permease n=1 Tax=unclassified Curtobacterium TaxID=257496 RepID=UPI000B0C66C2|nr:MULTISPECIES: SLC13 family permease [unclassified Curtobacterium]WIA95465.1 SLC13 family permease [Curtobacterium sp. MCBA15_004]WIA98831.1 SLC13 family permease [Curtobacterium sp. MCBA15_012]
MPHSSSGLATATTASTAHAGSVDPLHGLTVLAAEGGGTQTVDPSGSVTQLVVAALAGIVVIIALITWLKVHPFIALLVGALGVGIGAGLAPDKAVTSFGNGFGATMTSVGILVGLGAMFGRMLVDSGAADRVVDTLVRRSSKAALPWTMALIGALIGLPMFFEVGLVLLIPIIVLVAKRSEVPIMKIAVPALVGLSTMHAFVPPHPGPLVAVSTVGADLGTTLAFGIVLAIPVIVLAGPLFARLAARWVDIPAPDMFSSRGGSGPSDPAHAGREARRGPATQDTASLPHGKSDFTRVISEPRSPSFAVALVGILLPVVLMLAQAVREATAPDATGGWVSLLDFLGSPTIAIGIAAVFAMVFFAIGGGMDRTAVAKSLEDALPPIAGVLLIVGAGGGFKQVLIDTGIGGVIADAVQESGVSVLLVAWAVSALVRVATGSATVATVTAAGIMAPIAEGLSTPETSLLVLAIGAGSVFLSHVNDAGFWLVKGYLGTTVGQTFKSWTVLECLISVIGLGGVLLAGVFL